ncbi:MAG: cobyrinate a,c-diamide synthase [Clostridia bacterium]|nr:cobyrinate a,c-diamide synthase [Clostridia bacterium]MCI2014144.1 cobyrinate a,c-diamide synthase [Clostridia bacterium]
MSTYRIMFSAPKSGCGKTTITAAVLKALKKSGLNVMSFKCGPDYIDPMFHSRITENECRNLDLFMSDENTVKMIFDKNSKNCDFALIEGAMGYYDGLGGSTVNASAYETAVVLNTDTVLIVDGKGSGISLAAEVSGMKNFREDSRIKGIIINRVSKSVFIMLKKCIEKETDIEVLGYMPEVKELCFESRYLGLMTPENIKNIDLKIDKLADIAGECIDLDKLKKIAYNPKKISYKEIGIPKLDENVVIACAKDRSFNFYYEDNIDILKRMGAEIEYFSPLKNEKVPENADGLLIGGGYPELYAEKLSSNTDTIKSINSAVNKKMPIIAECGGYMYTCRCIENNGRKFKMADIFDIDVWKTKRLGRFGYISLTSKNDSLFGKCGTVLRGHEFHYFDSSDNGNGFSAVKPISGKSWYCGHLSKYIYAGFPHLYFYSNIDAVYCFMKKCLEYKEKK